MKFTGRRWQPLWERIHDASLQHMGVGTGGDVNGSGEVAALREILASVDRPIVLDVGANVGDYTAAVIAVRPDAMVYAFEPGRVGDNLAGRFASHPNFNVERIALSDADGEAILYSPAELPELASLVHRDLRHVNLTVNDEQRVRTVTLDGWAADHGIDRIDLLKIDVEGHELAVLAGARDLLAAGAIAAIQFEFGGCNIDNRTFMRDFWQCLSGRYRIYRVVADGLFEVSRHLERHEIFTTTNFVALSRSGGRA